MPRCLRSKIQCSLVTFLFISLAGQAEIQAIGNAYDRESGEFLYSEHHSCISDNPECLVDYIDSSGSCRDEELKPLAGRADHQRRSTVSF